MNEKLSKLIAVFYYVLLFFVPIILWPKTSEVFEFNKMVLTYMLAVLVLSAWATKMILQKKFLFRRTILDIPLLIFLGSQALSTLTSIDFRTSILGYYSRFNGGFLSSLSYALLYWAFVSNMDRGKTLKSIYALLASAVLVSIYGVAEHFGIDKDLWVQDVQNRVFSTLGQPNWLAAWLVALLPLSWSNAISNFQFPISNFRKNKKFYLYAGLSVLFFLTLLYTKSRSGLLGFMVAYLIFWPTVFWLNQKKIILNTFNLKLVFSIITSSLLLITLLVGTPWTPGLSNMLRQPSTISHQPSASQGPALEVGGTESGTIRKIVWKGAVEIWKHYPILGTGPETFAYAYYMYRPVEHNLVSEWDFLYNKAHNEYLNYLANTGLFGFGTYLFLIGSTILVFIRSIKEEVISNKYEKIILNKYYLILALAAGYVSILVSNFFGFSVVPTQLLFFLFPGVAVTLSIKEKGVSSKPEKLNYYLLAPLLLITSYLLFSISRYWYADLLFAKARLLNDQQKPLEARGNLINAIGLSPNEAIFYSELSESDAAIALALDSAGEKDKAKDFIDAAISESNKAVSISAANLNLKRNRASIFIKLSIIDPKYLHEARDTLLDAVKKAPTDAKLFYNLGLTYARIGNLEDALKTLKATIELKPNYRDARLAYALILIDKKEIPQAKEQLLYILEKINPNDALVKGQLEEIK